MHPQAVAAAEIDPGGGQQIAGGGQRQELGDAQPAPAWEGASRCEPAGGRAQDGGKQPHQGHQGKGVQHLLGAAIAEVESGAFTGIEGKPTQAQHRCKGQGAQQQNAHRQQAALGAP